MENARIPAVYAGSRRIDGSNPPGGPYSLLEGSDSVFGDTSAEQSPSEGSTVIPSGPFAWAAAILIASTLASTASTLEIRVEAIKLIVSVTV